MTICCRCNAGGICRSCACVKAGGYCTNCLPIRRGHCSNTLHPPSPPNLPDPPDPPDPLVLHPSNSTTSLASSATPSPQPAPPDTASDPASVPSAPILANDPPVTPIRAHPLPSPSPMAAPTFTWGICDAETFTHSLSAIPTLRWYIGRRMYFLSPWEIPVRSSYRSLAGSFEPMPNSLPLSLSLFRPSQ